MHPRSGRCTQIHENELIFIGQFFHHAGIMCGHFVGAVYFIFVGFKMEPVRSPRWDCCVRLRIRSRDHTGVSRKLGARQRQQDYLSTQYAWKVAILPCLKIGRWRFILPYPLTTTWELARTASRVSICHGSLVSLHDLSGNNRACRSTLLYDAPCSHSRHRGAAPPSEWDCQVQTERNTT